MLTSLPRDALELVRAEFGAPLSSTCRGLRALLGRPTEAEFTLALVTAATAKGCVASRKYVNRNIRCIGSDHKTDLNWTPEALALLQYAAEAHITQSFEASSAALSMRRKRPISARPAEQDLCSKRQREPCPSEEGAVQTATSDPTMSTDANRIPAPATVAEVECDSQFSSTATASWRAVLAHQAALSGREARTLSSHHQDLQERHLFRRPGQLPAPPRALGMRQPIPDSSFKVPMAVPLSGSSCCVLTKVPPAEYYSLCWYRPQPDWNYCVASAVAGRLSSSPHPYLVPEDETTDESDCEWEGSEKPDSEEEEGEEEKDEEETGEEGGEDDDDEEEEDDEDDAEEDAEEVGLVEQLCAEFPRIERGVIEALEEDLSFDELTPQQVREVLRGRGRLAFPEWGSIEATGQRVHQIVRAAMARDDAVGKQSNEATESISEGEGSDLSESDNESELSDTEDEADATESAWVSELERCDYCVTHSCDGCILRRAGASQSTIASVMGPPDQAGAP